MASKRCKYAYIFGVQPEAALRRPNVVWHQSTVLQERFESIRSHLLSIALTVLMGHTVLFVPLTSIHTHANASDRKRKLVQKVFRYHTPIGLHSANSQNLDNNGRSPYFRGIIQTSVQNNHFTCSPVQSAKFSCKRSCVKAESCFYSRYFFVPNRNGGLRSILDLRHLNRVLMKCLLKMLTLKQIFVQLRPVD